MRNKRHDLTKCLPLDVRLDTYKRALKELKSRDRDLIVGDYGFPKGNGLCLTLPVILWGLSHYLDDGPKCNERWCYNETVIGFPELAPHLQRIEMERDKLKRHDIRIEVLTEIIDQLSESAV